MSSAWETIRETSIEIKGDKLRQNVKNLKRLSKLGGSTGIKVGDRVLLRHGTDQHATQLRRHGHPAMRTFTVLKLLPKYNAVEVDPAGTTIQPVVSIRHCVKAPEKLSR